MPVSTMKTNIGTSSVTGGTTNSATLVDRKIECPRKRPKTAAYAASSATNVETATDETVTRKLFHIQRGSGSSKRIVRSEPRVGWLGKPLGSSWEGAFDPSAGEPMNQRGEKAGRRVMIRKPGWEGT